MENEFELNGQPVALPNTLPSGEPIDYIDVDEVRLKQMLDANGTSLGLDWFTFEPSDDERAAEHPPRPRQMMQSADSRAQISFEEQALLEQAWLLDHWPEVVAQFAACGAIQKRQVKRLVQASEPLIAQLRQQGDYTVTTTNFHPMAHAGQSTQVTINDMWAAWDIIPLDGDIDLSYYERQLYNENHISGTCADIIARAAIMNGFELARYDDEHVKNLEAPEQESDAAEELVLSEWVDHLGNGPSSLRHLTQHIAASMAILNNQYTEVIRGDASAKPDDETPPYLYKPEYLRPCVASSMRVIRGSRGYAQFAGAVNVWYNNYTPKEDERQQGVALWADFWAEKGMDVDSDAFLESGLAPLITSAMPEGVFNPHCNEVIHFKGLSLTSHYYGFPRAYRLTALHELLDYALTFNNAFMRNHQRFPFMVVYHGNLTKDKKQEIYEWLSQVKGARNVNKVPVIEAPVMPGTTGPNAAKTGVEVVQMPGNAPDGVFLSLIEMIGRHFAMVFGVPEDVLWTINSNRASIEAALQRIERHIVGDVHETIEPVLRRITREDMGLTRRYIQYKSYNTDDEYKVAQAAQIAFRNAWFSINDIRQRFYGEGPIDGGESYFMESTVAPRPATPAAPVVNTAGGLQTTPIEDILASLGASTELVAATQALLTQRAPIDKTPGASEREREKQALIDEYTRVMREHLHVGSA